MLLERRWAQKPRALCWGLVGLFLWELRALHPLAGPGAEEGPAGGVAPGSRAGRLEAAAFGGMVCRSLLRTRHMTDELC